MTELEPLMQLEKKTILNACIYFTDTSEQHSCSKMDNWCQILYNHVTSLAFLWLWRPVITVIHMNSGTLCCPFRWRNFLSFWRLTSSPLHKHNYHLR